MFEQDLFALGHRFSRIINPSHIQTGRGYRIFAPDMHEYTIHIYASAFVRWLGRALSRDEACIISTLERQRQAAGQIRAFVVDPDDRFAGLLRSYVAWLQSRVYTTRDAIILDRTARDARRGAEGMLRAIAADRHSRRPRPRRVSVDTVPAVVAGSHRRPEALHGRNAEIVLSLHSDKAPRIPGRGCYYDKYYETHRLAVGLLAVGNESVFITHGNPDLPPRRRRPCAMLYCMCIHRARADSPFITIDLRNPAYQRQPLQKERGRSAGAAPPASPINSANRLRTDRGRSAGAAPSASPLNGANGLRKERGRSAGAEPPTAKSKIFVLVREPWLAKAPEARQAELRRGGLPRRPLTIPLKTYTYAAAAPATIESAAKRSLTSRVNKNTKGGALGGGVALGANRHLNRRYSSMAALMLSTM